jgi:hypothetical protein
LGFIGDSTRSLFNEARAPLWSLVEREAAIDQIPARSEHEAAVVLVFVVPGTMMPPAEFAGMRTSSYVRESHAKQMQIQVPPAIPTPEVLTDFLGWAFTEGPTAAFKALRRQRIVAEVDCATEAARRIVASLAEAVDEAARTWDVRRRLWERP